MFGLGPSALLGPDTPQGKAPSQLRAIPCLLRHAEREHCAARQENGLSPYIRVHAVFLAWRVMWSYLGLSAANLVFRICLVQWVKNQVQLGYPPSPTLAFMGFLTDYDPG